MDKDRGAENDCQGENSHQIHENEVRGLRTRQVVVGYAD